MANNILSYEACGKSTYTINGVTYTATTSPVNVEVNNPDWIMFKPEMGDYGNTVYKINSIPDTSTITKMNSMFLGVYAKNLDVVKKFNTSNVVNMHDMFYNCHSLKSLNLSGWNVSNVTDMHRMFQSCHSLESLNLSGWDVSNVTDMSHMFSYCHSLKSLDLSGWDVSNVTDMSHMFDGCHSLESLNLSGWNVNGYMDYFLRECYSLKSLDLSGSDINPTKYTFGNHTTLIKLEYVLMNDCTLESIEKVANALGSHYLTRHNPTLIFTNIDSPYAINITKPNLAFDFSGNNFNYIINTDTYVADKSPYSTNTHYNLRIKRPMLNFDYMFKSEGNNQFVSFSVLPDSSELRTMTGMFLNSEKVTNLDLSMINVSKVYNVERLVEGCNKLVTLDLSNWNLIDTCKTTDMFKGCTSLRTIILKNSNAITIIEDALAQSGIPTGQVNIITA